MTEPVTPYPDPLIAAGLGNAALECRKEMEKRKQEEADNV